MGARVVAPLGEWATLLACYLVLCLCGWAVDHLRVPAEPAP